MDDPMRWLLYHGQPSWQDECKPQLPADKLLYHVRQRWDEFCSEGSISYPVTEFKNYLTTGVKSRS
jgi:hypothetical protein